MTFYEIAADQLRMMREGDFHEQIRANLAHDATVEYWLSEHMRLYRIAHESNRNYPDATGFGGLLAAIAEARALAQEY